MKKMLMIALLAATPLTTTAISAEATDANDRTLSAKGDATKGKREYNKCKMCHNLTKAARHRLGPNLNDLFGSKAGSKEGFRYSKALKEADFVWTEEKLNKWLEKPRAFLPGNRMAFAGIRKEEARLNLLAYLREATSAK